MFGDLYRRTLTAPAQAALYRSVPVAYVWDDHDYGPNNADGARQLAWLERELVVAGRSHAVVVWVNPDPWIAAPADGADDWGGYPRERRAIADVIAGARIDNLIMVSGDAHMVALDDGSHSGYSGSGHPGFPVLQAGALDRPGSVKGGPYSHGTFPGGGQFGTITVTDDAAASRGGVELTGRTWRNQVLVSYRTNFPAPPASPGPLPG
ncbi:alkaline phosphatase D family protein [Actinoplanes solisilvae]|uniref:alkaline phosphatase D family protein n=1 Tax=Actinoplanes solisilvae TaxID=2486853 RepID=UPI0013E3C33D|nr:alkaline phosphatase D family protein [Actinoplanes solisilvae]